MLIAATTIAKPYDMVAMAKFQRQITENDVAFHGAEKVFGYDLW
jgi:hypothetical protein